MVLRLRVVVVLLVLLLLLRVLLIDDSLWLHPGLRLLVLLVALVLCRLLHPMLQNNKCSWYFDLVHIKGYRI